MLTLQPLKSLRFEPFALSMEPGHAAYFDALTLAQYLIKSHRFEHPPTRRPIARHEVEELERHLRTVYAQRARRGAAAGAREATVFQQERSAH